ncbi:MAG TPA: serine/threonine-protein kinase [Gaiellaceae bacterium]|nr:serine/threonine-protein kinase [Gaiellaceae bacterium]
MLTPSAGDSFGAYRVESLLGRGGMGSVYLATHERLGRKVALKLIAADLASDETFRARFLRESQLAASLDHPNVIPIYDADEVEGVLYLAMRYVGGPSLHALVNERGPMAPSEALTIAEQIGGALDAAHAAGLVHRDVKPANVLVAEPGGHAYLCDFGLAKRASGEGVTQTGSFLGTVAFCSPEQIEGRPLDGRSDVYSLGCVLFYCLIGRPPYVRESDFAVLEAHLRAPPPAVGDAALDPVLAKAMAKDPGDRYETGGALAEAVGRALDPEATRAAPPRPAPEAETHVLRRRPRRGWLVAAAAVALAAALAAAGLSLRGSGSDAQGAKLRTFVDRIENVLEQSAGGREQISSALDAAFDCSMAPRAAGRQIASVADNRQSILLQLGTLQTPTEQADEVVTLLQGALQQSIEADRHYRDGLFAVAPTCPLPRNASFTLAATSNAEATTAKKRFVRAFNPLADQFGRRTWSAGEI